VNYEPTIKVSECCIKNDIDLPPRCYWTMFYELVKHVV